jgi:hypothetical protein
MTVAIRSLADILKELGSKSEEANKFAKLARQADGSWDMSKVSGVGTGETSEEKLAWFQGMQKQINELMEERDLVIDLDNAVDRNGKTIKELTEPNSGVKIHHPGKQGDEGKGLVSGGFDSMGHLFTKSDTFKLYRPGEKRGPAVDIALDEDHFKALMGGSYQSWESKTLLTETGFAPQAVRIGLIVPGALRRPVVADLLPQGTTNQIAIVYMEETTTTNAADSVAEGAAKPESALAFTQRTAPVQKIATWLPVTDELLADEPAMRSYIEARLRTFLALEEERQLLNGDGTPPDIRGMLNITGIQTYTQDGAEDIPDAAYHAMTLIQTVAFLDASGMILHPTAWEGVRLMRTSDGLYIWGSPSEPGPDRMWGLPVVRTTAIGATRMLVGAFDTAVQMFRRSEVSFAVSDQNEDYFIKNKLAVRVEERFALAAYRPSGLVDVTLV